MLSNDRIVEVLSEAAGVSNKLICHFRDSCLFWGGKFMSMWTLMGNLAEKIVCMKSEIRRLEEENKAAKDEIEANRRKELEEKGKVEMKDEWKVWLEERYQECMTINHANKISTIELELRERKLEQREKELDEERRLLELQKKEIVGFGLGETSNPAAMAMVLKEMGYLTSTVWNDNKMKLLDLFLAPLKEHLKDGWSAARFALFWHLLLKNEYVSKLMAKKHKNAYFNVKLVMNILGWLHNKGVFDLNYSGIDQLLQGKATHRMYLSQYDDSDAAYSLLDAEIKRLLDSTYNTCILLE